MIPITIERIAGLKKFFHAPFNPSLSPIKIIPCVQSKRLYYLSFIKLIVYPLAGLVVLWLLPLEFEVAFTVFIALACPAGASVIMFAQRYDRDAYYASEIFVITTCSYNNMRAGLFPIFIVLSNFSNNQLCPS